MSVSSRYSVVPVMTLTGLPTSCCVVAFMSRSFCTSFFWESTSALSALRSASSRAISASLRAVSASISCALRMAVSSSLLTSSASRAFSVSMNRNAEPACAWKMEMQHMAVPARDRYTKKKTRPM